MPKRFYPDAPSNLLGPACGVFAITPSDNDSLAAVTRGIYVGGGGDLVVVPAFGDGSPVTFTAVPTGMVLPVMVSKVNATNTTATNLLALY